MIRSPRFWPWFVGSLLLGTAAAQGIMLYAATHDPSFAVEPDYYRKAVAWDSTMADTERSDRLGWRAVATMERLGTDAQLDVQLTSADGSALRGARVRALALHNLEAAQPTTMTLREISPGNYVGTLVGARHGLWEIRVDALRGGARFNTALRADLAR